MQPKLIAAAMCALMIGGMVSCTTSPEQQAAIEQERARLEAEIAARQGESVARVCPRRNNGWRPFGRDSLLLEAGGQWYRVELAGTCDPERAFAGIATRGAPGSSCVSRGDNVFTSRPRDRERCVVTAIHAWDEAGGTAEPAAPSSE